MVTLSVIAQGVGLVKRVPGWRSKGSKKPATGRHRPGAGARINASRAHPARSRAQTLLVSTMRK